MTPFQMDKALIHITALDCLPFNSEAATAGVMEEFIRSQNKNIFSISSNYNADEDAHLVGYDYKNHSWTAGRFIGEAIFNHKSESYKITIKPRFGEKFLLRMLEEIFNIRITTSASQPNKNTDWRHYIKRIIAFIWLQKLANANLHGLPKINTINEYKGQIIRGRLNIKKSAGLLYYNEVVSICREKKIDDTIAQIIFQAYHILKSSFDIGSLNLSDSAQEAINQIHSVVHCKKNISEKDYASIKYKDIYLTWKPIVDLSWDIIRKKEFSLKQGSHQNGFGFFIDMAEVWEQYLRVILKKALLPNGWRYKNEKQIAYKGYFFQRELIPDLVFQKEDEVVVWDAKYKRMQGRFFDIDRSDFFQIHTYIQYHLSNKKVKAGGLLYPISTSPNFKDYQSSNLINENGTKLNFSIDGIELIEREENEHHLSAESAFIRRIINKLA